VVTNRTFDRIELLYNYPPEEVRPEEVRGFLSWLGKRTDAPVVDHYFALESPINYEQVYQAAVNLLETVKRESSEQPELALNLSSGTGTMEAVWLLLGKTTYPAELIQSSVEQGVVTANVPFEIYADFLPSLFGEADHHLNNLEIGRYPASPAFQNILHRSEEMKRVIRRAQKVAPRSISVLIEGESGTGKELFARAIHHTSPRHNKPFKVVNCSALPKGLVESELFGHTKGAFTGAATDKRGLFEEADRGTLFLDEIGEVPIDIQAKLLRAIGEGEILPIGSTTVKRVDVRIIAATNRSLMEQVSKGRFREDLFYRLAVGVLTLPPLRERSGDISILLDSLLATVNEESDGEPGYDSKVLSVGARKLALAHSWPGNVRELWGTVQRAALWSEGRTIETDDLRAAIVGTATSGARLENRPLGHGFSLPDLLAEVAHGYLVRAMEDAGHNKRRAAELLGLPSYQTLTNWLKKYGLQA
jgi:transcriptional regulator with PAS, ATPase and Fis domain